MRRERQVDADGSLLRRRRRKRPALARRLQPFDRVGQQADVEIESHRADVAALLRAQQVARPADLQIAQGDLEAGPQLRRLEDRL